MEGFFERLPFSGELFQPDDVKVPLGVMLQHFPQLNGNGNVVQTWQQRPRIDRSVGRLERGLVGATPSVTWRFLTLQRKKKKALFKINRHRTFRAVRTRRRAPTKSEVTGSSFLPFMSTTCGAKSSLERSMSSTWSQQKTWPVNWLQQRGGKKGKWSNIPPCPAPARCNGVTTPERR